MEPLIQGTINALGFLENNVYHPEPDCLESIRDLIRFLRNDTNLAIARRACGERNIIGCDLIPIMRSFRTSDKLFDITLRLTINLCQPAALTFVGRDFGDKEIVKAFFEVEKNLKDSKEAFGDVQLFKVFESKVSAYFAQDWLDRLEETKLVIERIFVLVRYILLIGDTDLDKERTSQDVNSHDQLVLALLQSGFGKLLVQVSANSNERYFHLCVLEIFAMMLKQYEAKDVVEAESIRSTEERKRQEIEMQKVVEMEKEKQLNMRRCLSSRHTSFAGTYILKGLKAINKNNDMVVSKVLKNCNVVGHLNTQKIRHRVPKNRRLFHCDDNKHLSCRDIRVALRSFCLEMLQKSYSRLMSGCRDGAFSARRTLEQTKADIHYFVLMQFSMEFCRLAGLPEEYVDVSLNIETFHLLQTQLDDYMEKTKIERKEARFYGLRAQYALVAYKELLFTQLSILKSGSEEWKKKIESTCSHILKVEEYRDLSTSIIRRFMPGVFSKTFLQNIILANHAYISLVENFSKKGMLYTVTKRQKLRKRHAQKSNKGECVEKSETSDQNVWNDICEDLSETIFGFVKPNLDISAIDVLLNVEDSVHKQFAMLMVHHALQERRVADAVGVYRAARDLWPTNNIFGTNDMNAEDEFLELRAIYFVDLKEVEEKWKKVRLEAYGPQWNDGTEDSALFDDKIVLEEEKECGVELDSDASAVENEVDFNFGDYVAKFARADILKWYFFVLTDFESNTMDINKAVLKLLHRIAFDLKMAPRLYQLSLFIVFKRLALRFKDQSLNDIKRSKYFDIYQFGFHILRRFFADYRRIGSKLIPEILFLKGSKECYEISNGYGSFEIKDDGKKCKEILWPENLENELKTLYNEYLSFEEKPEGVDIVEYVEQGLSKLRTRRQIIRQIKLLGLSTFGARSIERHTLETSKSLPFAPEIIHQMHNIAKEYNSKSPSCRSDDLVNFIRHNLSQKYTRAKIIKHLQQEGIYYELPLKKRRSKALQKKVDEEESDNGANDVYDISDEFNLLGSDVSDRKNEKSIKRKRLTINKHQEPITNSIDCFSHEDHRSTADDDESCTHNYSGSTVKADDILIGMPKTGCIKDGSSDDGVVLERKLTTSDQYLSDVDKDDSRPTKKRRIVMSDSE